MRRTWARHFREFFFDLVRKENAGEISSNLLDLRGLLDAIALIRQGLSTMDALHMGILDTSSEEFERVLLEDLLCTRMDPAASVHELFEVE